MKSSIISFLVVCPLLVFSFSKKKWKKTEDGIYYQIFSSDTTTEMPMYDDYVWMHLKKYSPKNKEVFNTRVFDKENGVELQLKHPNKKGEITDFFTKMHKGDSAIVKIPVRLVDRHKKGKKYYTYYLNLYNYKRFSDYQFEKNQQYARQLILDSIAIYDYMFNNRLDSFIKDEQGIWYKRNNIEKGNPIINKDKIKIHYIGKLINNVEFDNSYLRNSPLEFTVNSRQVIDGLDKGILHFYKGDQGTLIIPSHLAYGEREVGKIPPNSILVFDIEILK